MSANFDFIIIGAGLAGLTAHHRLVQKGFSVLQLEKDSIVGGRVKTHNLQGAKGDAGAQFFTRGYPLISSLVKELNLETQDSSALMDFMMKEKNLVINTRNPFSSLTQGLLTPGSFFKLAQILTYFKIKHRNLALEDITALAKFDNMNAEEFCLKYLNKEILQHFFAPYFSAFNYANANELSASMMVRALAHMAEGKSLFGLSDGLASLPLALSKNKNIMTGTDVLEINGNEVKTDKGTFKGNKIIVATTATVAKKLLKEKFPEALSTKYSPSTHEAILIKKSSKSCPYGTLVLPNKNPFINVITHEAQKNSKLVPEGLELIGVLRSREGYSQNNLNDKFDLLNLNEKDVLDYRVTKWDEAIPVCSPGRAKEVLAYRQSLKASDQLVLVGDYLGTPCAEGAVESGNFVANLF